MSLIKSISGIRGTIGGRPGEGLSPVDVVKFTAAYSRFIIETSGRRGAVVVGPVFQGLWSILWFVRLSQAWASMSSTSVSPRLLRPK